jgi:hypothetical protein
MEHVQRQSFLALRPAERLGLPPAERETVYYASLLAWVGCHVDDADHGQRGTFSVLDTENVPP